MIDEMKCCANCEYWYLYDENKIDELGEVADGECRRYPPNVPIVEPSDESEYSIADILVCLTKGTILMGNPFVYAGEWCGEFKLMDEPRWTEEDLCGGFEYDDGWDCK